MGDRPEGKAAIGVADRKLIIKLNRRNHMSAGSRLVRARMSENYALQAFELRVLQLLYPVC